MTFLCNAKPEYGWLKKVKALEPHEYVQWRNGAVSLRDKIGQTNQAELKDTDLHCWSGLLMDGEELATWNNAGVEMSVDRVKGLASNARELQQTIFQVAVSNIGLMQIRCVDQLEDCDTCELQTWLDRGWRILAVYPPNDTRKATFVMGHFDKEPHR